MMPITEYPNLTRHGIAEMRLELESGKLIQNPNDDDVTNAFESLDRGDISFVILGQTETTYIQAFKASRGGFVLEYQDGSLAEHYRSAGMTVSLYLATCIFQKYAKDDNTWRRLASWHKVSSQELSIPEGEKYLWLIDAPRPRQVKKESRMRFAFVYIFAVVGLGVLAFGSLKLWGLILVGLLFATAVLLFLLNPDSSANLLASGDVAMGTVVEAEWEGNVEAELGWRLVCKFKDCGGRIYTARREDILDDTKHFKVGDILPVFYDSNNPNRNYLLLDPDRIVWTAHS